MKSLKELVAARLAIVADHGFRDRDPSGHLAALKEAHGRLEAAVRELPPGTDPRLIHFLERQSYEKALAFLQESDSAAPR